MKFVLWRGRGVQERTIPHSVQIYLHPISLIERIYLFLILTRIDMIWSIGVDYNFLVWSVGRFGYFDSEKQSPAGPSENAFSSHPTSRSCLDTGNPSGFTISLGAQTSRRVQRSPTKDHMYYKCFCSTLDSILPRNN